MIKLSKNVPSFKNNKLIFCRGGKPVVRTNPDKQKIMNEITLKIRSLKRPEKYPVKVIVTFLISDNRRRDLDGMFSTVLDCMVRAKIIQDDSIKYVSEIGAKF